MHKQTKATGISKAVRHIVLERDEWACINCHTTINIEIAHYIRRSQGGLGIPENLVCLCHNCHSAFDSAQDDKTKAYHARTIRHYLDRHYYGFSDVERTYWNPNEPL